MAKTNQDSNQSHPSSMRSNVHGRRLGRPLRPARQKALENGLARLQIPEDKLGKPASLKPETLFTKPFKRIEMEIGFGDGKHLASLMQRHLDIGFIGAEPFINGMSSFLRDTEDLPQDNIAVHMDDAMQVVNALSDGCLDRLYILNPDPWHKKRHHKRRIVNPENLDQFARILKPGADLILSTDVPYLAEWMLIHSFNHPAFEWCAERTSDWKTAPENWITTTYETKRAKGADQMSYLIFKKTLA